MENNITTDTTVLAMEDALNNEIAEIKRHLGVQDFLARQFAEQVIRLRSIDSLFNPEGVFSEDGSQDERLRDSLTKATKSLNYRNRPYQIAFMGSTSAGKSRLVNALLGGRKIVQSIGASSVTGTVVKIFFDSQQEETIIIKPYSAKKVMHLVDGFNKQYSLNKTLPDKPNEQLGTDIRQWQPDSSLQDKERHYFELLRGSLADMINDYVTYGDRIIDLLIPDEKLRKKFQPIEDKEGFKSPLSDELQHHLLYVMDESSEINKDKNRVRLISSLSYYLKPLDGNQGQLSLNLPANLCLVDLPGYNREKPLHDIIFEEGVREANIAVLTLRPDPLEERNSRLFELVKKNISDSDPDCVFLVLNHWDAIRNNPEERNRIDPELHDIMTDLSCRHRYYVTASAAYDAQLGLQNKQSEMANPQSYESSASALGVKPEDYRAVLEATNVPLLLLELTNFIHNRFIRNQIDAGRAALDEICERLQEKYPPAPSDQPKIIREVESKLNERLEEICDNLIFKFHSEQQQTIDALRGRLRNEVEEICAGIESDLREKLPVFWKNCWTMKLDRIFVGGQKTVTEGMQLKFLNKVQFAFWEKLPNGTQRLASILVNAYQQAVNNFDLKKKIVGQLKMLIPENYLSSESSDIENKVEKGIMEIQNPLFNFSKYVALSQVTGDTVALACNGKPQAALEKSLDNLQNLRKKELAANEFNELLKSLRQFYRRALFPETVESLIQLYEHQMACIHMGLEDDIRDLFVQLKARIHQDSGLSMQILETINYPDLKQRELLAKKREEVRKLCQSS